MNIDKRLDELRERLERSKPCQITLTLKSGEQIITDQAGVWTVCHDYILFDDVVNVAADRPEYSGLSRLIAALCHPAPNRRLEDYE